MKLKALDPAEITKAAKTYEKITKSMLRTATAILTQLRTGHCALNARPEKTNSGVPYRMRLRRMLSGPLCLGHTT